MPILKLTPILTPTIPWYENNCLELGSVESWKFEYKFINLNLVMHECMHAYTLSKGVFL